MNKDTNTNEEKLVTSDDVSLLVPLKTLKEWIDAIDSISFSLNQNLYVDETIKDFIKKYNTNK